MIRAIVISALILAASPAQASTEELLRALMRTMNYTSQTMTAEERRAFAAAGVAYWENFDSRIPRNSPADDAWLDGEMNTTDSARIMRMAVSPQYSLRELAQTSETCVQVHELLVEHIGKDRATELYLWLKASHCYARADTLEQLRRAGLSDGSYDGEFKMGTFGIIANNIVEEIANSAHEGL